MAIKFAFPDNISDETQKFMRDVMKELNRNKAISNIDLGALRMLAISYEMYLQASEDLLTNGPLVRNKFHEMVANPAQTISTKNYAQVIKIMTEYGLTIKSRAKLAGVRPQEDEDSPLDQFLKKQK